MKKEYVFPHNNWYLEFTEEERPIVDNWRINIIKYSNTPCPDNIIRSGGSGGTWRLSFFVLITIDQFKQYILNIQEPIIEQQPENLLYLIDLFKQLKIK